MNWSCILDTEFSLYFIGPILFRLASLRVLVLWVCRRVSPRWPWDQAESSVCWHLQSAAGSTQYSMSQPASSVGPVTLGPPSRRHQIRPVPAQLALQVSGLLASFSSAGPPTRACQLRPRPPASQQVASPPVGLRPTVRRAIHHAADGQPECGFTADTTGFSGKALHPSTGPAVSETATRPNPRDLSSQWVTSGPIKGIAFIVPINRHFKLHFRYTNSDYSFLELRKYIWHNWAV